MDLGCLDLGCISLSDEKQMTSISVTNEPRNSETSDSSSASAKVSKSKSPRNSPLSGVNALNKFTSQIKKPSHRKTSPLNWFPRKKVDSYLKRKIKLIQEVGGMNDTLDETLGHSNPHYCRVEREKMAAREAASKVMEARKAAMVEASWCRILQAARISNKKADELLSKAEKEVTEAFEAATSKGVIMYDTPNRPWKNFEIETSSSASGKGSKTTHTVKASFETAFEVDKKVAAAVKTAFTRLAYCPSFSKVEFKDLLKKISENPESQELSDSGSELETGSQENDGSFSSQRRQKKISPQKFNGTKLVDMMVERLKCLKEEELASLATIVATCGLNAALAETESGNKEHNKTTVANMDYNVVNGGIKPKQVETDLLSLDKFLVKKLTKLEKEVQEARNSQRAETNYCDNKVNKKIVSVEDVPDLGSVLLKHRSKLEREIEEAKRKEKALNYNGSRLERKQRQQQQENAVPSLDKVLIKCVSRLERDVQKAKNRRKNVDAKHMEKENVDSNELEDKEESGRWDYKKQQTKTNEGEGESLDKVLVKHVSRLEKERMGFDGKEILKVKKKNGTSSDLETNVGGLDQILIKQKSRLEREKTSNASQQPPEDGKTYSMTRREARERALLETWGGIGLGHSMQPRVSRLEREKAAWLKAEEEEKITVQLEQ